MKDKLLKIKELIEEILSECPKEPALEVSSEKPKKELSKDFEILKDLLFSDGWPEAVFQMQIADENSETDKEERAEGICDILLPNLENKKFLDFGCGEGHVAKYMSKNSLLSVGYDINKSKSNLTWEELKENCLLTLNFDKVRENGPYDAIMLYDVVDHSVGESNEEILLKAISVLSENGKIYMRTHPWTSRHGGHLYKKINKAFIHLVFSEEELIELGFENIEPNHKFTWPIKSYNELIESVKLKKENEEVDTQEVESFFNDNPLVRQRILNSFGENEWRTDRPVFQMSQCFIDYILTKQQ